MHIFISLSFVYLYLSMPICIYHQSISINSIYLYINIHRYRYVSYLLLEVLNLWIFKTTSLCKFYLIYCAKGFGSQDWRLPIVLNKTMLVSFPSTKWKYNTYSMQVYRCYKYYMEEHSKHTSTNTSCHLLIKIFSPQM